MNSLVCFIASYAFNSLWEIPLIGAAGWAAQRFLRSLGPLVQHAAWTATLAFAILAPATPLFYSLRFSAFRNAAEARLSDHFFALQTSATIETGSRLHFPALFIYASCLFYLGAFIYFAGRFAWTLYRTFALVRDAKPISLSEEAESIWTRCRSAFSISHASILGNPRLSGPAAVQFTRPILLLPEQFANECTTQDLWALLLHECAHLKRHDFHKNLVYEIGSLLIAFHPVTWLIKSQIAQTREMVCDSIASNSGVDAIAYARSLLRLAAMARVPVPLHPANALGFFETDTKILEKRIMMLKRKKSELAITAKLCLLLSGAAFLLSIAAASAAMTQPIQSQNPAAQESAASVIKRREKTLACTYYDAQTKAHPGTCWVRTAQKSVYYCFRNDDPAIFELQHACASRVEKYLQTTK